MAEVFVGAGAGATFVPEMDLHLNDVVFASNVGTLDSGDTTLVRLLPDLYVGCRITVGTTSSSTDTIITANTINTITVESVADGEYDVTIHAFGAPVPGPKDGTTPTLLSDHWLGLVDTFTPPNIEVEMKQLNLAVSGSRNYSHQFKAAETVSGGSLELMLNNGSWLYYALGAATFSVGSGTTGTWGSTTDDFLVKDNTDNIVRSIDGNEYPFRRDETASATGLVFAWTAKSNNTLTVADLGQSFDVGTVVDSGTGYKTTINEAYTTGDTELRLADAGDFAATGSAGRIGDNILTFGDGLYVTKATADIDYEFTELNGDTLPSFALEVTYDKSTVGASTVIDSNTNNVNRYCRIFTGCQVNSLTLNFEEGQELRATVDMVTKRAFDAPNGYLPRRGVAVGVDELQNYHKTREGGVKDDDYPFMFSDGSIKLFGQSVTRVKSGNLTITNSITPQRFIGNTNRQTVSAHIPAQRTYEIGLTMLVTDTELWDELRGQDEFDSTNGANLLELKFTKGNGEEIEIKLDDYIIQNVNVPFPADKGPVEVEATISARTLNTCTYSNAKWAIMM